MKIKNKTQTKKKKEKEEEYPWAHSKHPTCNVPWGQRLQASGSWLRRSKKEKKRKAKKSVKNEKTGKEKWKIGSCLSQGRLRSLACKGRRTWAWPRFPWSWWHHLSQQWPSWTHPARRRKIQVGWKERKKKERKRRKKEKDIIIVCTWREADENGLMATMSPRGRARRAARDSIF